MAAAWLAVVLPIYQQSSQYSSAAVAERRQTIPILANLRLKASSGRLEVTATDLEIQVKNYSELLSIEFPWSLVREKLNACWYALSAIETP